MFRSKPSRGDENLSTAESIDPGGMFTHSYCTQKPDLSGLKWDFWPVEKEYYWSYCSYTSLRYSFANCEDIASIEDVRNPHSKRRQPLHCVSSQYIFGSTEWFLCPNQPNHKHSFVTTENRKEKVAIKNNVRYVNIFNILAVCRNITLYCQHFFWSLGWLLIMPEAAYEAWSLQPAAEVRSSYTGLTCSLLSNSTPSVVFHFLNLSSAPTDADTNDIMWGNSSDFTQLPPQPQLVM